MSPVTFHFIQPLPQLPKSCLPLPRCLQSVVVGIRVFTARNGRLALAVPVVKLGGMMAGLGGGTATAVLHTVGVGVSCVGWWAERRPGDGAGLVAGHGGLFQGGRW